MNKRIALAIAAALASPLPALAQSTAPTPPQGPAVAGAPANVLMLTEQQANNWLHKSVYSSDGKNLGEVAAFARDANGRVSEMQ